MLQYLKNIIPRISEYSKTLDKLEVFVDKPWIYIDEYNKHHQYLFMRDLRLIMSLNGKVTTGKWELLPTKQLLINRISDEILLQHLFVEDSLLILKRVGTEDNPFILINEEKIPNLDVVNYLEEYVHTNIPNVNNYYKLLSSGKITGPEFNEGKIIETQENLIFNGIYQTNNSKFQEYVIIENNMIKTRYYNFKYIYNNIEITIDQQSPDSIKKGDKVNFKDRIDGVNNVFFEIKAIDGEKIKIKVDDNFFIIDFKNNKLLYAALLFIIYILILFIMINKSS